MGAPTVIKVTVEHITEAGTCRQISTFGPIHFAMKDAYPDATVDVYSNWMHACGHTDGCFEATLPPVAEEAQYAWADRETVQPFEFTARWERAPDDEED